MPVTELDWDTKVIRRSRLAPGDVAVLLIDIWSEPTSAAVSAALKQDNVFRFEPWSALRVSLEQGGTIEYRVVRDDYNAIGTARPREGVREPSVGAHSIG